MFGNFWHISLARETTTALEWSAFYSRALVSSTVTLNYDRQCQWSTGKYNPKYSKRNIIITVCCIIFARVLIAS
jgi:hypothetical protein